MSPVKDSPRSWMRHILITRFMSVSRNSSSPDRSIAISAMRKLWSATLSLRSAEIQQCLGVFFSFPA